MGHQQINYNVEDGVLCGQTRPEIYEQMLHTEEIWSVEELPGEIQHVQRSWDRYMLSVLEGCKGSQYLWSGRKDRGLGEEDRGAMGNQVMCKTSHGKNFVFSSACNQAPMWVSRGRTLIRLGYNSMRCLGSAGQERAGRKLLEEAM